MKKFIFIVVLCLALCGCQQTSSMQWHDITQANKPYITVKNGVSYGPPKSVAGKHGFPDIRQLLNINFSAINF